MFCFQLDLFLVRTYSQLYTVPSTFTIQQFVEKENGKKKNIHGQYEPVKICTFVMLSKEPEAWCHVEHQITPIII